MSQLDPLPSFEAILKLLQAFPVGLQRIYPPSLCTKNGLIYGMIRTIEGKKLIVIGLKEVLFSDPFEGKVFPHDPSLKLCDLSRENTLQLMERFPFTRPVSLRGHPSTIGTGDCLGLATPGHIRAVRKFEARPVLGKQSILENRQTGRDFHVVIADAAWSVFQENYRDGYGANGHDLKSLDEVGLALDAGFSMITLDLSKRLNPEALSLPDEEIDRRFQEEMDPGDAEVLLHLFLEKEFRFSGAHGDFSIRFSEGEVKRNVLFFRQAIDFSEEAYEFISRRSNRKPLVDFEISMSKTPFPTSPANHLFLIISLRHRGVRIDLFAPGFPGEFQKGSDDRGEISGFRDHLYCHVLIAQHYGDYKISIHTGSDHIAILPHIGELSRGKIHLKTAGASWLEAVRLIALMNPALYREIHRLALSLFQGPSEHDRNTVDISSIPLIETLSDPELPDLLERDSVRPILHMMDVPLLREELRGRIYNTLMQYEEDYATLLENNMEKQLECLGFRRREQG